MNWPPDPKSWFEFPAECLWYLLPGGMFHIIALIVSLVGLAILYTAGCRRPRFSTAIIFQGYLLVAAMIANGFWSCIVWGRLYWSVDYTSDFSVFIPITRSQVEYSWGQDYAGGLNGITLTTLNMIWLAFAAGAWLLAFGATRWTQRRLNQNKLGEQDAGGNRLKPVPHT